MRVACLINMPAPYRAPVFDRVAAAIDGDIHVFYLSTRESNRAWSIPELRHPHTFLRGVSIPAFGRDIHLRYGIRRELRRYRPDVVLTGGFAPAMLAGWLFAIATGTPHIAMSDAWAGSERDLTRAHRVVRRIVVGSSAACVGASRRSLELFVQQGATGALFQSPLCVDNARFARLARSPREREYDLVFAGRLEPGKRPDFFVEVVRRLAATRRLRVLVVGDGSCRREMAAALGALAAVHVVFTGFIDQDELPAHYARGRVLCFPTVNDAWGIVANEALAAGLAVITSPHAGCAGELVLHGENGYVLDLDAALWATHVQRLLADDELLARMSERATLAVSAYTFDAAARGILDACASAYATRQPRATSNSRHARDT